MNRKLLKIIFLICFSSLSFTAMFSSKVLAQELPTPPDFTLRDIKSNNIIRLYDFSNKVILLNFMTTWCPWDAKEFDDILVPLYETYYKNDTNVIFLTIHLDPHKGTDIQSYIKEHNINWPVLEGGIWSDSQVAKDYGVNAVPTTFIIKCQGDTRQIIYYKRGYNPESLNKFYQVIENAKLEIIATTEKDDTEIPQQATIFSSQFTTTLPNGNTIHINYSTSSQVVKLSVDSPNNRISISVDERGGYGFFAIYIPIEFLKAFNSSIEKLTIVINGEEIEPIYLRRINDEYLLQIEYDYGRYDIDIYYVTFSLTVHVQSLFGLPISKIWIALEWPDGKPFKETLTSSSGTATFKKIPCLNSAYTIYIKNNALSFQYLPKQILINQDTETSFTAYLYFDTLTLSILLVTITIATLKIKKPQKTSANASNKSLKRPKHTRGETHI
nr:TlpA disulfide reductase family protein [Candidatus Sigynarchaeota archaeon]